MDPVYGLHKDHDVILKSDCHMRNAMSILYTALLSLISTTTHIVLALVCSQANARTFVNDKVVYRVSKEG